MGYAPSLSKAVDVTTLLAIDRDKVRVREEPDGTFTIFVIDGAGQPRAASRLECLLVALVCPVIRTRLQVPRDDRRRARCCHDQGRQR